jgi:thiol-disulfide isomerase/thioredoxin
VETVEAEAAHSFAPQNSPLVKYGEAKQFRKVTFIDVNGNPSEPQISFDMPQRWGSFDRMDAGAKSVTELPPETIRVDGVPVQCRVVQVVYANEILHPEEASARYWIDKDRLLVLKEQFAEHQGRQHPPVSWQWVYTVDSVKLNQPPPQWFIDASNQPPMDHARTEWVGRTAPDFVLFDLDGHQVNSSSMHGMVVVLDFWATWCGPCRKELPIIEKVAEDYQSQGVQFWGISLDEEPSIAKKWMADNHTKLRTMIDPETKTADQYQVQGIPAVVVIERSGKVVSYYDGNQSAESLRSAITLALREARPENK